MNDYRNFNEMEREGRAAYQLGDSNCPDCNQQICACESLADWHNDVDAAYAISAEASARSEPADFLGRVGSKSAVSHTRQSDKVNSGSDVRVPAEPEIHQHFHGIEPLDTGGSERLVQGERDHASLTVGETPTDADHFPVPVLADPAASGLELDSDGEAREIAQDRASELKYLDSRGGETSFGAWLEKHADGLPLPTSFTDWLDQNGDSIIQ